MMKILKVFALAILAFGIANCNGSNSKGNEINEPGEANGNNAVIVYYFHSEHRCPTCLAVEAETKATIESSFKKKVEAGKLKLEIVNVDLGSSKVVCEKYKVYGSSLLLVKGDNVINLTSMAFANARKNAEKFRQDLQTEINNLLK
jgi:hypothetical protein